MEAAISLQDVANIITFLAPGFFAVKTYDTVNAKAEKDFAVLTVLSTVCSLPIVALYNWMFGWQDATATQAPYAVGLVGFSIAVGLLMAGLRRWSIARRLTKQLRLPAANDDFLQIQFDKIPKNGAVLVKLKSGELFSGTPKSGSTLRAGDTRRYFFNNVAWFDQDKRRWDEHTGSIIIAVDDIQYIETATQLSED